MGVMLKKVLLGLGVLLVVVTVVVFMPSDDPAIDETFETLAVISAVRDDVNAYYAEVSNIPVDLTSENFLSSSAVQHADLWKPYINSRFVYERVGNISYRICASFAAVPSEEMRQEEGYAGQFMFEQPGGTCFDLGAE